MKIGYRVKERVAPICNRALACYGKIISKKHNVKDAIVISGVPRGGTTWLYEILLQSIPNTCGIWEPLFLRGNSRLKKLGFSWRQYIPAERVWPEAEKLFRDILTGRNLSLSLMHNYKFSTFLRKSIGAKRYLVKFCRANRLVNWLSNTTGNKKIILLIRHPCAVVASQLYHGGWRRIEKEVLGEGGELWRQHICSNPWIGSIIDDIKTEEEKLAFTWCMDYYILFSQQLYPGILVSYEKLVTDGENELKRVFYFINTDVPENLQQYLHKPSVSTKKDSNVLTGGNRLSTWKKRLTREQQKRILSIVSRFGLDFYSEDLEPDYGRLYEKPLQIRFP